MLSVVLTTSTGFGVICAHVAVAYGIIDVFACADALDRVAVHGVVLRVGDHGDVCTDIGVLLGTAGSSNVVGIVVLDCHDVLLDDIAFPGPL